MAFPLLLAVNLIIAMPKLVEALVSTVAIAETIFCGQGLGAVKKQWVMSSLAGAVIGFTASSTGGQLETWERISKDWPMIQAGLGDFIDFMAGVMFPKEIRQDQQD